MTTDTLHAPGPDGRVACPLCDGSLAFRAGADALDCTGCGVILVLAPDPAVIDEPRCGRQVTALA